MYSNITVLLDMNNDNYRERLKDLHELLQSEIICQAKDKCNDSNNGKGKNVNQVFETEYDEIFQN